MKRIIFILCLLLITGCTSNNKAFGNIQLENDYFNEKYEMNETNLKMYKLDFPASLNREQIIDDKKYILLLLGKTCEASKSFLNELVKVYNNQDYKFDKIYIFEVEDYLSDVESETEENREKFKNKFDISSVPVSFFFANGKKYATEVGYYPDSVIKDVLDEFDER